MEGKSTDWLRGPSGPTVCRCCFAEGCYKDISTEYFWMGKREVYAEMLTETFDLSIAFALTTGPNSNSRLICEPCISRLRDASEFKRQVQECERMFMQYLDPGRALVNEIELELTPKPLEKEVKLEPVKEEKGGSDNDFDDRSGFDDMDDDDLDDQPLTKLASKVPKKESVDLLDLLDNAKAEKRKSSTKVKAAPAKKTKKKDAPKASASKAKPEKKKKDYDAYHIAKRNAEIIVQFSTAYPFRLPESSMVCVYCCESYDDPALYRKHMNDEHQTFKVHMAFGSLQAAFMKADCTELRCRLCSEPFESLQAVANHLHSKHDKKLNLTSQLGIQPFKLEKDRLLCAICSAKFPSIGQLSRHTQTHFLMYTCDTCGKSYVTHTTLNNHIKFSHLSNERTCRKCKTTFPTVEARRQHVKDTKACHPMKCQICCERFLNWQLKEDHLVEVHNKERTVYPCAECGQIFQCRGLLSGHFKTAHTNDNECTYCNKQFPTKQKLKIHVAKHTGEREFACNFCDMKFVYKESFKRHVIMHDDNKKLGCPICERLFVTQFRLKEHIKKCHPLYEENT